MAVREALLTLLAVEPNYGFRLHTELIKRLPHRQSLNVGQSYTTLERARKTGLVSSAGATDDGLPLFALTAAGTTLVSSWFAGTDGVGSAVDETSDRVLLLASLSGMPNLPSVQDVLDAERGRWQGRVQGDSVDVITQRDELIAQAMLHWLDEIEQRLPQLAQPFVDARPRRGRPVRKQATQTD